MTDKIDRTHGSTGTKPADGKEFVQDERPKNEEFDWFWYTVPNKIDSLIDDITAIVNGETIVGEASTATEATNVTSTFKGNDLDSDGDGKVNSADYADNADQLDGNDASHFTTLSEVNNNADVPNADTVDGYDATALLGGSTDNVSSVDLDSGQYIALQRFNGGDIPNGTDLVVRETNVTNGDGNSPSGLNVIVRDESTGTNIVAYNGLSFNSTETYDISGTDVALVVDNGNFTGGTGSNQTNVTGHITYDLR